MTKSLRKISLILLFVVMVVTLALATACGIFSDTCSHDEVQLIVLKEPTATEKGQVVRRCLVCNKTVYPYWETYPLNDYTKYDEYEVTKAPTHTESGHVKVTLAFGSYNVIHFEGDISPTQHKLNIFVPVDAQYHVATCSCGEQGEQSPHNFRKTDNVAATCTEPGYLQYTCADCNYTYKNYLSDQLGGHVYENGRCKNCNKPQVLTINYFDGDDKQTETANYLQKFDEIRPDDRPDSEFVGWFSKDGQTRYTAQTVLKCDVDVYAKWLTSITISTKEQFLAIKNNPDGAYRLANDINLGGEILSEMPLFGGVLNGDGHVVKNFGFQIRNNLTDYHGLIKVNEGIIRNITLADYTASIDITEAYYSSEKNGTGVGGVIGHNKGTIDNLTIIDSAVSVNVKIDMQGDVRHTSYTSVGAIVGKNEGTIESINAKLSYTVYLDVNNNALGPRDANNNHTEFYIGHVIGTNYGTANRVFDIGNMTVTANLARDKNWGEIHGHQYIGGIVGRNVGNVTVSKYSGTISYNKDKHNLLEYEYTTIGGLAALNYGSIGQSFAAATVYGASDTSYNVGGFVGQNLDEAKIAACYAISTIVVKSGSNNRIGGFVATNQAMIQSCYASGEITMQAKAYVGGFAGYNDKSGSILRSFVATMKLSATEGYAGQFVAENLGTTRKAYYALPDETNNYYNAGAAEVGSMKGITEVTAKAQDELLQNDLLSDALYWNEDSWVLADGKMPTLQWLIDCGLVEE